MKASQILLWLSMSYSKLCLTCLSNSEDMQDSTISGHLHMFLCYNMILVICESFWKDNYTFFLPWKKYLLNPANIIFVYLFWSPSISISEMLIRNISSFIMWNGNAISREVIVWAYSISSICFHQCVEMTRIFRKAGCLLVNLCRQVFMNLFSHHRISWHQKRWLLCLLGLCFSCPS